jgi:phosphoglycerate dehydrogenase-like enzyme
VTTRKLVVWMYAPEYPIWSMPEPAEERLREELEPEWTVRFLREEGYFAGDGARRVPGALLREIRDAEVYLGFGLPREPFLKAERLRWVHSGAAGVGGSLFPEMRESDVVLTNSAGLHAEPLAEHAVAVMLHFGRGLDVAARAKRERRWAHAELAGRGSPVRELSGRTVGIVGYGGIGSAVGRKAVALGMRVWGLRRRPAEAPPEVERMLGPDGLHELLEAADYVVLAVPETPRTEGMIGLRELSSMGQDAVLVNVSRGDVVAQDALVEALEGGRLRGAGLDVFEEEPLPGDSPLWERHDVVITPHTGAVSPRFWDREVELILENLRRYRDGDALVNVVDKERGY